MRRCEARDKHVSIGERLRAERLRLAYSQEELASLCHTNKHQQIKYEKDKQAPGAYYLAAAIQAGVDVRYVLTAGLAVQPESEPQDLGARLREERERLGMTQQALGEATGKNKQTQLRYETGQNSPTTAYLISASRQGVDAGYVLTGYRNQLHQDEKELLARYRAASRELRRAAVAVLAIQDDP